MANVQWFPGHMIKAERMMQENIKLVDVICEIVDARVPVSSRNPDLDAIIAGRKPRLLILNRNDQADQKITAQWISYYRNLHINIIECDARSGKGLNGILKFIREISGKDGPIRAMVCGVPNVGKSTFINKVSGRKATAVSDRPGVTRGKQWVYIDEKMELLDTPGILWPKFEDQSVGEKLAITGAVKDLVVDVEDLSGKLLLYLREFYPEELKTRYKIDPQTDLEGWELLEKCARKRGFLISGGEVDTERMANILLDEFRSGKIGRISLERPD